MTNAKPLSQRPVGYALAVLGGFLGGPIGLFASPIVLLILNRVMPAKDGKQPNRFLRWSLIGIIAAPLSIAPFATNSNTETQVPTAPSVVTEPNGDNKQHYDWLKKECDINMKMIEESGYSKSASQLGRRGYCTEAEEMRERITGVLDSSAPGAKDFGSQPIKDTTGVNMANYLKLQNGMTYQQAVSLLGREGEEMSSSDIAGYTTIMYKWDGDSGIGSNMNAMFQNGKLTTKAQFGLR
jgi:hypothetical protein